MNKQIKSAIVWMAAALFLVTLVPVMAAAPTTLPPADGIVVEDVIQNQFTVEFVGEVPDPKDNTNEFMDGTDGMKTKTIREAILKDKDGNKQTMKLGKEMKNFDQIKEGDKVTFMVERQVAFFIGKEGLVPAMGESTMKFSAPKGQKPGAIEVKQSFVTLEIMKLDPAKKALTVRLPDNTIKTVNTPNLNFASVKVGQNVIVQLISEQSIIVTAP